MRRLIFALTVLVLVACGCSSSHKSTSKPANVMTMGDGSVMTMAPGQTDTTTPTPTPSAPGSPTAPAPVVSTVTPPPADTPTDSPTAGNEQPPVDKTVAFKSYVETAWGNPSWISEVNKVTSIGGGQVIDTTLTANGADAGQMCAAMSNYELTQGGFTGVTVRSSTGSPLVQRQTEAQDCG